MMSQQVQSPAPRSPRTGEAPEYGVALMLALPCLWMALLVGMAQLLGTRSPAMPKDLALAAGWWNIGFGFALGFTLWIRRHWAWSFLVGYLGACAVVSLGISLLIAFNGFRTPGLPDMPLFRMLFQWFITSVAPTALFTAATVLLYRSSTAFGVAPGARVGALLREGSWLLLATLGLNVLFLIQLAGTGLFQPRG